MFFLNVVDLSSKWESLKLMHIFETNVFKIYSFKIKQQFLNSKRICKSMVFGVKSATAVGAKGAVINIIIMADFSICWHDMVRFRW